MALSATSGRLLLGVLVLGIGHLGNSPALAAQKQPTVSAAPGTLVRWSAPGTKRCSMNKRSWPALQETCYYPVDLLQKPGLIKITRWGHGPGESARISVEPCLLRDPGD